MNRSDEVKLSLSQVISDTGKICWLFSSSPGTDFSRNRKLDFEKMIKFILSMEGASINKELLKFFSFSCDTVTESAVIQQRSKVLDECMPFIFHEFNDRNSFHNNFMGYRLLACDGSDINIPRNQNDLSTYFKNEENSKGYNQIHLNALYDLCEMRYVDAVMQVPRQENETRAMAQMIDRCPKDEKVIFIADRGYECYNVFAHAIENNSFFVIRAKEPGHSGTLNSVPVPNQDEFDIDWNFILTRSNANVVKENPDIYKKLHHEAPFDFFTETRKFYPMKLRIVYFPISETTHECLITNLPRVVFPLPIMKKIYNKRWGIETSFRDLKYSIGLTNVHSKRIDLIKQEIWARLIMYNFCELIISSIVCKKKPTKYGYQLNYTVAIHICRHFFRTSSANAPPDIEALIGKYLLPIRPGRQDPRKARVRGFVGFTYRVA